MITTVLYDMDGLLLDTEPQWGESMLRVARKHNIPIAENNFKETTGLRIYEVTEHWANRFPWHGSSPIAIADEILDDIIEHAKVSGSVLIGVEYSLQLLRDNNFKIGLASSSPFRMIDTLIKHFGIEHYFHQVTSADAVEKGKPHPAVFLHCAQSLRSAPQECLVLEDSINGMIAGKAARMKVVVVPDKLHFDDPRFSLADMKLTSLEDLDLDMIKKLS